MKKFVYTALLLSLSCFADKPAKQWQEKMQKLGATLAELLPQLVTEKSDLKTLEKNAKLLSELAHGIDSGRKSGAMIPAGDFDPSVALIAEQFADTTQQAYLAIRQDRIDYGKGLLRAVTSYCIGCHTRHDNGPDFPTFPLNVEVNQLSSEARASLYLATRQFDKGLQELESLVGDGEILRQRPFGWGDYLRQALAVSVRVKKDPELASKTLAHAMKQSPIPEFELDSIQKWKVAIETWKNEKPLKNPTEALLMAEVKRLSEEARKAQHLAFDHDGEIQYLRATALAHDVLRSAKSARVKAEALYYLGTGYEALATPHFWPMHELWYEACIRELPKSKLALDCYNRLEESVYFGYTGSSGTHLPPEVQQRLKKMKGLALGTPVKK